MYPSAIGDLCAARGWTRTRLIAELRRVARERNSQLPGDESLKRMVRKWANGHRELSVFYADLFSEVFGVEFDSNRDGTDAPDATTDDSLVDELSVRLTASSDVDAGLIRLLEDETQSLRLLDRRLGARGILAQTEIHLTKITDLLAYSINGGWRESLAAAAAEVAALAGWQALDLGDAHKAWRHHEMAKAAARESADVSILAHVTAQQAHVLIDLDRGRDAAVLMERVITSAGDQVPQILRSWLWAATAEAYASYGDEKHARYALDKASHFLANDDTDPDLPFVVLDEVHLQRWRGHCLARLGASEAVDELSAALTTLDPSFTRAASALHCDLAFAYTSQGEIDAARNAASRSAELANQTSSVRQRRRLRGLLRNGVELSVH